ncbi:hypothetical protein AWZ03_009750 [Drosophila navojoa]|uniref:Uncharacterized protein n=1 Tax=Drosophila navojoa TaxID=7232 RepID=A0A484B5B5_DRONA|nr:hypothetical protein AWZ03_009750 [Drosophila navojoa]
MYNYRRQVLGLAHSNQRLCDAVISISNHPCVYLRTTYAAIAWRVIVIMGNNLTPASTTRWLPPLCGGCQRIKPQNGVHF